MLIKTNFGFFSKGNNLLKNKIKVKSRFYRQCILESFFLFNDLPENRIKVKSSFLGNVILKVQFYE